ncbi:MAG: hypothetical protein HY909_10520 [Deltaproteobacteria bacterium]|nr:hypothetical protein [Deltaproteobacteria bacterium]
MLCRLWPLFLVACAPQLTTQTRVTFYPTEPSLPTTGSPAPTAVPLQVAAGPNCDLISPGGCPPPTIQCPAAASAPAGQPVRLFAVVRGVDTRVRWEVLAAPEARLYRFAERFDPGDTDAVVALGESTPFTSVIVGSYTVQAVARDALGREASCEVPVVLRPHGLRVELSWNTANTDVDLHLTQSTDPRWFTPGDCYYANRRPDVGLGREPPQRWLDTDDTDGEGPENIRIDEPSTDRDYVIGVHYYSSHGSHDATRAIALVYCGDQRVARFERDLRGDSSQGNRGNDFWTLAAVRFDPAGNCRLTTVNSVTTAQIAQQAAPPPVQVAQ